MDQFGDWRACRNEGSDVEFLIENEEHYINVPHYTAWRSIQTCQSNPKQISSQIPDQYEPKTADVTNYYFQYAGKTSL